MRLRIEPFYVADNSSDIMLTIDQLTLIRNYVRKQVEAHEKSANGASVSEIEVEVAWQGGDVEVLAFDATSVGFPISPQKDWYGDWLRELKV